MRKPRYEHVIQDRADQAKLISSLMEGYRMVLLKLDSGKPAEEIRAVLDTYYPGPTGNLFKETYGRDSRSSDTRRS